MIQSFRNILFRILTLSASLLILSVLTVFGAETNDLPHAPGGEVTDKESFISALGGYALNPKENEIILSADLILDSPLVVRGGDYLFSGGGCTLYRGFEEGDLLTVTDGCRMEIGRKRKDGDDITLTLSGGIKCIKEKDGAVSFEKTVPTLIDPSKVNGSLLCASGGAEVRFYRGTVMCDNVTLGHGGALRVEGGSFTLASGLIENCYSSLGGGNVYVGKDGIFSIGDATLCGGVSDGKGGNLFVDLGGDALIGAGMIKEGVAEMGGGIYASGTVLIQGGEIVSNRAVMGGGIYSIGENILEILHLKNNSADFGGGVYHASEKKLTLCAAEIVGSQAERGGALYNAGTTEMLQCAFSQNTAIDGGGVYNGTNGILIFQHGSVTENRAQNGGGVFNEGELIAKGISITANSASIGAGLLNDGRLEAWSGFYCAPGNSIFLCLNEASGAITLAEPLTMPKKAILVPGKKTESGYEVDYETKTALLIGQADALGIGVQSFEIAPDANDTYRLTEGGMLEKTEDSATDRILLVAAVAGGLSVVAVIAVTVRRRSRRSDPPSEKAQTTKEAHDPRDE